MSEQEWANVGQVSAGWFYAAGDPPDTVRYWDGAQWLGEPERRNQVFIEDNAAAFNPTDVVLRPMARIGARIVDGVIWLVLIAVPVFVAFRYMGNRFLTEEVVPGALSAWEPGFQQVALWANLAATALIVAYETLMNGLASATLGKKLVAAEVVDTDGDSIGLGRAFLRTVPLILLQLLSAAAALVADLRVNIFWLVALVGLIMLIVDRRRQTPWDKLAGTLVIKEQLWR